MAYTKDCYKGKYQVRNPKKYRGDVMNVVYRSSYELRFCRWCDLNDNVLEWGSEEVVVPYLSPLDNRYHRYFVDFTIKLMTKSGVIRKYLIEVKPFRYTQEPVIPKKKTQSFIAEVKQWGINTHKWEAARKYAKTIGAEFILITEKDLGRLS